MPPNPWLLGRAWQSWQGAMYPQAWAPASLPISASFLPTPLPAAGDPEQTNSLSKDGVLWLGLVPSPLTTKDQRSRISTKEFAKAISLYFVFLPFNQFAQAEDEWSLEGKEECVGTDPPGNSLRTLPRLVRLEKRFIMGKTGISLPKARDSQKHPWWDLPGQTTLGGRLYRGDHLPPKFAQYHIP